MILDLKNIHIGNLIRARVTEKGFDSFRICKFLKCTELEWKSIQSQRTLDSEIILRLSTLLEYDFFRVYSQHLILYAPPASASYNTTSNKKSSLPHYRKNIYTKEVVDFVLEQIENGNKTKLQIINEYRIPKTTLYKWISKYNQQGE
ncbi:helix-turn-helix domain-containing protein [Chryseobacterium sp. G0201]|uniref:helix-turn-helix domain-containing protein n=1 Tax=Chryseobacterium sp. G0201 TaxID=2487065 RepID=UPI000F4EE67E|nr:helix-turn-helix domain-containing protein [Chryseobacterium sp. G0201]AZA53958.1 transposase [Chryseobacterium sp. G0201]